MGYMAAAENFLAEAYFSFAVVGGNVSECASVYYSCCFIAVPFEEWVDFLVSAHFFFFNDINKAFSLFVCNSLSF